MSYCGQSNWPPVWVHLRRVPVERLSGEVGVLTEAHWLADHPTRIFLRMKLNEEKYIGALLLTDAIFCSQLYAILHQHIGRSIKEIGDLDLSYTL